MKRKRRVEPTRAEDEIARGPGRPALPGKWIATELRLPQRLLSRLTDEAASEGISRNALIVKKLEAVARG